MSLIYQHVHSLAASVAGAGVAVLSVGDITEKIVTGTVTGVLIWIATKLISVAVRALLERKCR